MTFFEPVFVCVGVAQLVKKTQIESNVTVLSVIQSSLTEWFLNRYSLFTLQLLLPPVGPVGPLILRLTPLDNWVCCGLRATITTYRFWEMWIDISSEQPQVLSNGHAQ